MLSIVPIPVFNDNYIWLILDDQHRFAYAVDPGCADELIDYLTAKQLTLVGILVTHHHHDHTGGISALQSFTGQKIPVYGPAAEQISAVNRPLMGNENIKLEHINVNVEVLKMPGHTSGHLAFVMNDALFCGDTLFSGGCGRLFEGTPNQMWQSLTTLTNLPEETKVYCAHEYTQANLNFACHVESNNHDLQQYRRWVDKQRTQQQPTLPSTIGLERKINPFLRCHLPSVKAAVGAHYRQASADDVTTFTLLRQWKDKF